MLVSTSGVTGNHCFHRNYYTLFTLIFYTAKFANFPINAYRNSLWHTPFFCENNFTNHWILQYPVSSILRSLNLLLHIHSKNSIETVQHVKTLENVDTKKKTRHYTTLTAFMINFIYILKRWKLNFVNDLYRFRHYDGYKWDKYFGFRSHCI